MISFHLARYVAFGLVPVAALVIAGSPVRRADHVHADGIVGISMQGNSFLPRTTTISAGTTVVWENDEDPNGTDVQHDVLAGDYVSWGSDYIAPGGTYAHTFNTPGTFSYLCDLHDGMEATIIVQ